MGTSNFAIFSEIKKKRIEPLASNDLSKVKYEDFNKCFYNQHEEIANLTQ